MGIAVFLTKFVFKERDKVRKEIANLTSEEREDGLVEMVAYKNLELKDVQQEAKDYFNRTVQAEQQKVSQHFRVFRQITVWKGKGSKGRIISVDREFKIRNVELKFLEWKVKNHHFCVPEQTSLEC